MKKMDCGVGLDLSLLYGLQFTSKLLFPKYPLTLFPLMSILYYVHKSKHNRLVVQNVPEDLLEKIVSLDIREAHADLDTCVLLNSTTLNKICSSGRSSSWLKLSKYKVNVQYGQTVTSCIVKAIGVDCIESGYIIASETVHFNIKQKLMFDWDIEQLQVWGDNTPTQPDGVEFNRSVQFTPNVAIKASIGIMQTPVEVDQVIIDALLGYYFQNQRYLCLGDLFSVNILKYAPYLHYSTFIAIPIIFFKVLELEGPASNCSDLKCGYFIKKDFTMLLQSVNQQGFLPPSFTSSVSDAAVIGNDLKSILVNNCPLGLDDYYNDLLASFCPFLHFDHLQMSRLRPVFLVSGPKGAGKQKVISSVGKALGLNVWSVDCLELKGNTPGYTEGKLDFVFKKVLQFAPCIIIMRNIDGLCTDNNGNEDARVVGAFHDQIRNLFVEKHLLRFPVLLVGTSNNNNQNMSSVTAGLARAFLHVIHLDNPNEAQRTDMLSWIIKRNNFTLDADVSLSQLAARSSGFLYEDLKALVAHAVRIQYKHLKGLAAEELEQMEAKCLKQKHFEDALEVMYAAYSDAIGAPKIPSVSWSDIGGLAPLKEEITRTITMPLLHPALVASGLRRSGILLYGPPGTGKTLLAKAVATECNLNFLSVKGPELLNMYVGQSEENVREVFERARAAAPCIIFFDELDSLAPNRGKSGDSAGVMDRVVSQLLAEMDGMQKSTHLYVIGATNRPDLIDPALLRPGRFDKLLYVGVCEDHEAQLSIMVALTRKFDLGPDVNLEDIVGLLPHNVTGADLFSVCSNAWRNAAKRIIHHLENGGIDKTNTAEAVVVSAEDFRTAAVDLSPSVTVEDLLYFRHLHQKLVTGSR